MNQPTSGNTDVQNKRNLKLVSHESRAINLFVGKKPSAHQFESDCSESKQISSHLTQEGTSSSLSNSLAMHPMVINNR